MAAYTSVLVATIYRSSYSSIVIVLVVVPRSKFIPLQVLSAYRPFFIKTCAISIVGFELLAIY
jgi:hypothetical protein